MPGRNASAITKIKTAFHFLISPTDSKRGFAEADRINSTEEKDLCRYPLKKNSIKH